MKDDDSSGSMSMDKRFKLAMNRIQALEVTGGKMTEVRRSLANIIKAYKKAGPGTVSLEEVESALAKIESLITVLESRNEEVHPHDEYNGDEGEPTQVDEIGSDDAATDEHDPMAEQTTESAGISAEFDMDANNQMMEEIKDLLSRITSIGGDTSPIDSYYEKLETAFRGGDQSEFETAYTSVRPWLEDYLSSVQLNEIEKLISRIEGVFPLFREMGLEDMPLKAGEKIEHIRMSLDDTDIHGQWKAVLELIELEKTIQKSREMGVDKARDMVVGKRAEVEKKVEKHADDLRVDNYTQVLQRIDEILKDDPIKANLMMNDLDKTIDDHLRNLSLKRLDRFLLSVEPLIRKVGALEGTDSELYGSLIAQKEELLRISEEDVNQALFQMEVLLDKAATTVTQAEEKRSDYLKTRIETEKEKAIELPGDEKTKVMAILGKAESALIRGEMAESEILVGRALTAYERIRERLKVGEMTGKLKEYESRCADFHELALDTSGIDGILDRARALIVGNNFDELGELFDRIEAGIESLGVEEVKVKYQRLMIPVVNTIRRLKEEGKDVSEFNSSLDEIKSGFTNREYESAMNGLENTKNKLDRFNLEKKIRDEIEGLSGSLDDADEQGLDTSIFRERLKDIESYLSQDKVAEAESRITGFRMDLEEEVLNRSIKGLEQDIGVLVADCIGGGIDTSDVEPRLKEAHDMVSDGRVNDAIAGMKEIKNELEMVSSDVRAKRLVEVFKNMIIRASILGIDTTEFKAASTKASVRVSANDIKGALKEINNRMKRLEDLIERREKENESADEIRGMIIAQEGRINILLEKDVQVVYLKEWVNKIKSLLDKGMVDNASTELKELDRSITTVFNTAQNRDSAVEEIRLKVEEKFSSINKPININQWVQKPKPLSIEPVGGGSQDPSRINSPNQARTELEKLVPLIKRAIEDKVRNGQETESYRYDLSRIKEMFVRKNYMEAYIIAESCLRRIHL